ncbi:MAG TPA: type IV secretion system protein [Candidatus Nitrosotalea sp.]|nr:type IV secretion system protein [Candidatus Nitrosotalea sp.]
MTQSRQDFVNWVTANEPQAFQAEGPSKWQSWATSVWPSLVSRMHEHEYQMWLQSGVTEQLRNMIRFSAGLPGVGTGTAEDFTGAKKRMGDAYRGYLAIAQNVVSQAQANITSLQSQLTSTTDPNLKASLQAEIAVQQNTLSAEQANVATWQKTISDALASGQIQ